MFHSGSLFFEFVPVVDVAAVSEFYLVLSDAQVGVAGNGLLDKLWRPTADVQDWGVDSRDPVAGDSVLRSVPASWPE